MTTTVKYRAAQIRRVIGVIFTKNRLHCIVIVSGTEQVKIVILGDWALLAPPNSVTCYCVLWTRDYLCSQPDTSEN